MKKLFVFSILTMFITCAVNAATKCIAMGASSSCTQMSAEASQSDWGSTCNNITIHGISACGTWEIANVASVGDVYETVTYASTPNGNTGCFCKIVQPVVSRWVFAERFWDGDDGNAPERCEKWCAATCAGKIAATNGSTENQNFHNSILGVLYE
jgi:hypothetical protein